MASKMGMAQPYNVKPMLRRIALVVMSVDFLCAATGMLAMSRLDCVAVFQGIPNGVMCLRAQQRSPTHFSQMLRDARADRERNGQLCWPAGKDELAIAAAVQALLSRCCPSTVGGPGKANALGAVAATVMAIVVDPLHGMARRGAATHVGDKVGEVLPALANADAAGTVVCPFSGVGVGATILHGAPNPIFRDSAEPVFQSSLAPGAASFHGSHEAHSTMFLEA